MKWFLQSISFQMKVKIVGLWHDSDIRLLLEKIFDEYMERWWRSEIDPEYSWWNKDWFKESTMSLCWFISSIRDYLLFLVMILQCLINQSLLNWQTKRKGSWCICIQSYLQMLASDLDRNCPYHCRHFYITDRIRESSKDCKVSGNYHKIWDIWASISEDDLGICSRLEPKICQNFLKREGSWRLGPSPFTP